MLDRTFLFGFATIIIGVISYSFYFLAMYRGRTKPDSFSWFIWGVLASITFFAQVSRNGGPGTWATAFTAIACFSIALIGYFRFTTTATFVDKLSLCGAGVALLFWYFTNNPLWTVEIAIAIGAIGFIPTFQKAFYAPSEETAVTYFLNACKFGLALFALQSFQPVTWLYPAALTVMNTSLAAVIVTRRII